LDISVGFTIKVKAVDFVGNWNESSGKYDGPFREAYDLAVSMLTAAWNALCAVAEKVVEALNTLVSWIWDAITAMFSPIINAIVNVLDNWASGVLDALIKYMDAENDVSGSGSVYDMLNALSGGLLDVFKPVFGAVEWVVNLVKPLLEFIQDGIQSVADFVGDIIATALKAVGGEQYAETIKNLLGSITDPVALFCTLTGITPTDEHHSLSGEDVARIVGLLVSSIAAFFALGTGTGGVASAGAGLLLSAFAAYFTGFAQKGGESARDLGMFFGTILTVVGAGAACYGTATSKGPQILISAIFMTASLIITCGTIGQYRSVVGDKIPSYP